MRCKLLHLKVREENSGTGPQCSLKRATRIPKREKKVKAVLWGWL